MQFIDFIKKHLVDRLLSPYVCNVKTKQQVILTGSKIIRSTCLKTLLL